MMREFEQRYGDKMPEFRGDFTPYWEDGAGSSARETALNRDSAERLVQAETLFAMLRPAKYPAERFYDAWRNVMLYDEHTWGAHDSITDPDCRSRGTNGGSSRALPSTAIGNRGSCWTMRSMAVGGRSPRRSTCSTRLPGRGPIW